MTNETANPIDAEELEALRQQIRTYVQVNVNVDEEINLKDEDNIFRLGYVSSLFATRLLAFIEKVGGIVLADDDIALSNFSSVNAMVKLVGKNRSGIPS
ncbi:MAG: acyl carrier protein [Betaproteobacteria bacterium]